MLITNKIFEQISNGAREKTAIQKSIVLDDNEAIESFEMDVCELEEPISEVLEELGIHESVMTHTAVTEDGVVSIIEVNEEPFAVIFLDESKMVVGDDVYHI